MVKVNDADGKTQETAIRIIGAEDRQEAWAFISGYLKAINPKISFADWDREYTSKIEDDDFETQYVAFRKYNKEIWFDWTWVYLFMR